jgi:hypothetical protein
VRELDVEKALSQAIEYAATRIDAQLDLVATREADIRDFPMKCQLGQIGPRRHIGVARSTFGFRA